MRRLAGCLLVALAVAAAARTPQAPPKPVVAVQPLGEVDGALLAEVRSGILTLYDVEVKVLPAVGLPAEAYYKPRARYRAEKLLGFLLRVSQGLPAPGAEKIVGLTQKDISTTKEPYEDWGIFGLGTLGGRTCVVSTYRLRKGNAARDLFLKRLVKVVNHEVGHTFGLEHCPTSGCLMEDAAGTIRTVDAESGDLCPACRALLGHLAKPPVPADPPRATP